MRHSLVTFRNITYAKLLLVSLLLGSAGCEAPSQASSLEGTSSVEVMPMCQAGCLELDPNPTAPGVFLSSVVTADTCFDGGHTDADQDGLSDRCEGDLAQAFAPELYYSSADETRHEPRWVARPLNGMVYIGYLFSYYRDAGSYSFGCGLLIPFFPSCGGHNGDSETIFLKVDYNYDTQHWVLYDARYSQHGQDHVFGRFSTDYPVQLFYPGHPGAYPRTYVAEGKHANYPSMSACNNGGTAGNDTCVNLNTAAGLYVPDARNIGSRAHHTTSQDCVTSQNPSYVFYGSGRQECYWTVRRFRGLIPTSVGGDDSDDYSGILGAHGF